MSVVAWLWLLVRIKLIQMSRFAQLILQINNSMHVKSNIYDYVLHRATAVAVMVLSLHDIILLSNQNKKHVLPVCAELSHSHSHIYSFIILPTVATAPAGVHTVKFNVKTIIQLKSTTNNTHDRQTIRC